jgi:hypothetical protein
LVWCVEIEERIMSRISKAVVLSILAFRSSTVLADNDANAIGIYFDQETTQNEVWIDVPGEVVGYLTYTDPTVSTIEAWYLGIGFGTTIHSYTLSGGGVNIADIGDPLLTFFSVGFETPLLCSDNTVLAVLTIGVDEDNPSTCIIIGGYPPGYGIPTDPAALSGGELIYFWPSVGVPDYPIVFPTCVAAINQSAPVPAKEATWGGVKSLYR